MEVETPKKSGFPNFVRNAVVVAVTVGVAVLSNPSQSAYVKYASLQLSDRFDTLCQGIELPGWLDRFSGDVQQACAGLQEGSEDLEIAGRAPLEALIDRATERKNFGVFSVYETQVINGKITTVGVFGQFATLP